MSRLSSTILWSFGGGLLLLLFFASYVELWALEDFALTYKAQLQVPFSGMCRFFLSSNDGSRLAINGKVIADHDGLHYLSTRVAGVELQAGPVEVELSFFHANGKMLEGIRAGATLKLEWEFAGQLAQSPIPSSAWSVPPELHHQSFGLASHTMHALDATCKELQLQVNALTAQLEHARSKQNMMSRRLVDQEEAHQLHIQQQAFETFTQVALMVKLTFQGESTFSLLLP